MTIKHKTENVFRFKTFSDRINEVDLRSSALYRVEHVNEIPDSSESYFHQCRQKWTVLNLTEEFTAFEKQLKGVTVTTLPQLLHHKQKVIDALLDRIDQATALSLQPLLELTVAIAKDLREDFYVHFQDFFERLIRLLETHEPEQTEWSLVCLASLFKVLKPFLCKDISVVTQKVIPLLSEKNQPDHIINFAVECFAFIVRNLKNKDSFLLCILKTVKQDESSVMGCGKLFYEMIRGLNGQFHSKGEEFLSILFDAFRRIEFKKYWEVLNNVMVQTVGDIFDYVDVKFMNGFWNIIHKTIENVLKDESEHKAESMQYLLHFLGQGIEFHEGKKVVELPKIINLLIKIIDQDFPVEVMMMMSKIGAVLLLSKNFTMDQLDASRLSKKILRINFSEVFESFVINSIGYSQFDVLILPDFLKYFEKNFNKTTLEILAKVVRQRGPRKLLEDESETDQCYNLNMKNQKTVEEIVSRAVNMEDVDEFLLALQILPHLITFDKTKVEKYLQNSIKVLAKDLSELKSIFLLAQAISSLHLISGGIQKSLATELVEIILPLVQNHESGFACLKILRFLIKSLGKSALNLKFFEKVHKILVNNLLSPNHAIRLITCQILSSFNHLEVAKIVDGEEEDESLFTIFRKIEEITPTIQTYRDQVLLLHKIEFDATYFRDIRETFYLEDAIKYCFGLLNTKFQLLFTPTKKVLESYINGCDLGLIWKIFKSELENSIDQNVKKMSDDLEISENDFINDNFQEFIVLRNKSSDPIIYRVRLWQVLSDSNSVIHDSKHRDIIELFMNFLRNEYEQDEDDEKEAPKARQKLLISHLQVLTKFNNPKSVFMTNELRKTYNEFLLHRNFYVQKLALDCLMQYKEDSIVTYKETLYNILNEKTFRQELVALKLKEKIREDHREDFIKILLPILYSKMTIKANKKDQEGFKTKKEIVTRFMSNLEESELNQLTDIAVAKISSISESSDMIEEAKTNRTLAKVNELQSMMQFLDLLKKNVAGLFSPKFQRKVLRNILAISCLAISNDTTMFKNLKQTCLQSVTYFFEYYDEFEWPEEDLSLIFEIFVFRHLKDFHIHSSQNVSGLMKLFVEWSKNPKYFDLLAKTDSDGNFALKSIVSLLGNKVTTASVAECVMDVLERLLTLKLEEEVIQDTNYGTKLVEPFVHEILIKLKDTLNTGSKGKSLNQRNLLILSRVTELVTDVESSKITLDILFPLTLKKAMEPQQDGEGILKLLTTISNLLRVVSASQSYIKQLSPFFEQILEVNHRKLLIKMFNQLLSIDDLELKSMINDLNAYDRRWIEQPDYERRLSVFHRIEKIIETGTLSMDLAILVIYHCFFFLKHEKDLAMRDNSGHFLKQICKKIIQQCGEDKQQLDYFVDKIILNLIQKRLKDEEKVRTESILLLGELARDFPQAHPIFADLHPLTNAANREQDFFDNITHLQKFRHMKALRKFPEIAEKYKQPPNLRTLNEFLLPIAKIFLCTEEYKKKSKVVEAAIEYISVICKFLPWSSYESVLKFYIRKFRSESGYHKQLVKLIPAILDAFHFDLSQADKSTIDTTLPENIDEEIESEEEAEDEPMEVDKQVATVTVLRQNLAQRVIKSLTRRLIPSLFKTISEISTEAHRLNKETRRAKEKADMVKIPIAFPIIKLLQKLPAKFLTDYLSQIVLKVSSFLKSNLKQVRAVARHTLKEVIIVLGPEYLEQVIGNLKGMLCKGFQVHVLSATVHTLMDALKSQLHETKAVDKLLPTLLNICIDDIFGKLSEEQEVDKIGKRTPEAKPSRKSFLTLNIIAGSISENCVLDLLMPFKNQLQETQSRKTVIKIQECLQKIVTGLTANQKIPNDALMILVHGIISESIADLLPEVKKVDKKAKKIVNDSFIIQAEPKRRGAMTAKKLVRVNNKTNSHVLVEFGLEMLHIMLKKKKFPDASFLNPLVPMLCDSLKSNFLNINTLAVKCLTIMWHHQLDLENLRSNVDTISSEIFSILHKYATNQISKKDNHYLLVKNSFKCIVVLMRHVEYFVVNETQLKALLLYVEQDLQSYDKDSMAFTLLKAILEKKLMIPEVHEIMKKVSELCVTSESDEKRSAIRSIVLMYLMEYPIGKKVDSVIKFFIAQLNYEEISGRESAILMMGLIFKHFPQVMLRKFSGLFFLSLGTRLVNDDSPACREKIAEVIELLIKQLDNNPREQLFEMVLLLLKDKKRVHREMAAQLTIRFVNSEGSEFEKRISTILPLLLQSFTHFSDSVDDEQPGKFVKVKKPRLDEDVLETPDDERDLQSIEDHHLIQTLNAILRIFEFKVSVIKSAEFAETIDEIGYQAHNLLAHEHVWVRLRALKIINFIVKSLDHEIVSKILIDEDEVEKPREFMYSKKEFRSVVFDMVVQIKSDTDPDIIKEIMENLIEVCKIIWKIPFAGMINDKKDFNLMWLTRRLRYAIHSEIASTSPSVFIRKTIFNFFNNLLDIIDQTVLKKLASSMLTPMLREMVEGEHVVEELKQVALLAGNRIKSKIGLQEYDKVRLELQSKMLRKRVDRRKGLAHEKINNPAKAATRTIVKQLKKQEIKKRKRQSIQDGIFLPRKKPRIFGNNMNDSYE